MIHALLLSTACFAPQGGETLLVEASHIVVAPGTTLENQSLLIREGKIARVGAEIPDDAKREARVLRFDGKTVVAGFVDPHTHLGQGADLAERIRALTPELEAIDAFDPFNDVLLRRARGGVTTAGLAPLSANTFAGIAGVVKTGAVGSVLKDSAYLEIALVDESLDQQRYPTSRMGAHDLIRTSFAAARSGIGAPDATGAVLRDVLAGSLPVAIHARSHASVTRALALCEEFHLRPLLIGAARCERLLPRIAALRGSVMLAPLSLRDRRRALELPAKLERAGIPFSFMSTRARTKSPATGSSSNPHRRRGRRVQFSMAPASTPPPVPTEASPAQLRLSAALAVRYGASRSAALAALTRVPAEQCGVAARCGSLRQGRDADFLVFDGDPTDLSSRLEAVYGGGHKIAPEETIR